MIEKLRRIDAGGGVLLVAVAGAIATIPIWISTFPPMVDLPQHAAQISLLRHLGDPGFRFTEAFHVNWFTPYLLGYLLVLALAPLGGILLSIKIVIAASLVSFSVATAILLRESSADTRWALLSIPGLYGFAYQWGFLNFLVAAPVGLLFLALVMRHARRPTTRTYLTVGVLLVFLFFCHAMTCVFFGSIAGLYLLREVSGFRKALVRISPMTLVVPVMLAWGLKTLDNPLAHRSVLLDLGWMSSANMYYSGNALWAPMTAWGWGRTAGFLPRLLGVHPGLLALLFGLLLFALPFAFGLRPVRRAAAWLPFAFCLAVLLFLPERLFGTDFTFERFTLFALPLFLVGWTGAPRAERARLLWPTLILVVGFWTTYVSWQTLVYEREAGGFTQVLARMEPGERALSLIFHPNSEASIAPSFLHYPAWYSALKGGVVDPSFAWTHVELVQYRPEARPVAGVFGFEWNPQAFEWSTYQGERYRYFVARSPVDLGWSLFHAAPCRIDLVIHAGEWWLYERTSPGASIPASR